MKKILISGGNGNLAKSILKANDTHNVIEKFINSKNGIMSKTIST
jgi:hypothetical protein